MKNHSALLGRPGRPKEIVAVIVFLFSDDASLVNAAAVHVDGATMVR